MPRFLEVTDKAVARKAIEALGGGEPEFFGADGNGTTDDTAAFVSLFASAVVARLRQQYSLDDLTVTNRAITGELFNTLIGADPADPVTGFSNPILRLRSGSALKNVTIDGDGQVSRRVDVGDQSGASNIVVQDVCIVDAASQSFRIYEDTTAFRMLNIYADGSRVFNTGDESDPRGMLFSGIICVNSPEEAFLLDLPGTESTEWTGFLISQGVWEASAATKRIISLARCYGGLVSGHVMRGELSTANPTDSHLLWVEDKAQFVAHLGNVLETNGSARAVSGSLGSENVNYAWADKNPKELLYTANFYKATDGNTDYLIWLEGSQPDCFDKTTVTGETLLCNAVAAPVKALAKRSILGGNHIYDSTGPEYVRTGDSAANNNHSRQGADIIRLPSFHVNPRFFRGDQGHGYNPHNVIFRTSFGFDTYANFQTWANSVTTVTGSTITAFGGSLGTSGTITFVADATTGAIFLRATAGTTAMTTRFDFTWDVHDIDFQQLDNFCVRLLTRSSMQTAGKLTMQFPSAGPGMLTQSLNVDSDYADWKIDGASKIAPTTANFYAASAGTVKFSLYPGDGLTSGETADYGLLAVSVNRSTPF